MKKLVKDKLALNRETIRTLTGLDVANVRGGDTSDLCTTGGSSEASCGPTCAGPTCRNSGVMSACG